MLQMPPPSLTPHFNYRDFPMNLPPPSIAIQNHATIMAFSSPIPSHFLPKAISTPKDPFRLKKLHVVREKFSPLFGINSSREQEKTTICRSFYFF